MKPRRIISYIILCVLVPAAVVGGSLLFGDKQYAYLTLCVAVLSCLPFFLHFEHGRADAKEMILIAAMVALSVVGRFLFAPIPGFKPVTAMTVITAMYFGSEAGFMTGALSAVISNFYFGQGPWTPFQMLSWGLLGFIAGLLADPLRRSRVVLASYGHMVDAVGGWVFQCFPLSRLCRLIGTVYPHLCSVKPCVSSAARKTYRQDTR